MVTVTDAILPHLDDIGMVIPLRAKPRTSGLPVIMLSAHDADERRGVSRRHGVPRQLVRGGQQRAAIKHDISDGFHRSARFVRVISTEYDDGAAAIYPADRSLSALVSGVPNQSTRGLSSSPAETGSGYDKTSSILAAARGTSFAMAMQVTTSCGRSRWHFQFFFRDAACSTRIANCPHER